MNLIEELKNYCDINNPVGALMLSGEWGCGKTYLIKTKFIPSVKDTYVFVCISLFGIDSLDKLRVEVKKKWLEKASEFDSLNGTKVSRVADSCRRIFDTIKDRLPENWQKKGEVVSSIMDLINFMPISNRMFMMTNKAGLLQKITRYGHLFWYLNVEKLYPELFDDNFIVDGFSKWVIQGEWNEDVISKEIQLFLKKEKAATPLEILRTYNLPEVDEEIIDEGFKDLLIEVYAGNLSLDEYILFLYNCCYSRMYDFDLPTIDWEKVREGIRKQIKYLVESDEKDSHSHRMIGDDSKQHFTEDEWSAYQIIKEFRDNNVWIYEKNQKLYIDLISSDLNVAFRELSNKRYNKFSLEMEAATINAFKNADNMDKNHFSGWFVGIWGQYSNSPEIEGHGTTVSLKKLRDDLNSVMQEYKEKGKNIAAGHTQNFIKKLEAIIKTESEDTTVEQ